MIKHSIWKNKNKLEIKDNRRIIGRKWFFRVKNDGCHCAQLCAIGYTQVAGADFQDNFAPVINGAAFWITVVLMMVYGWDADIADIETAFLYNDLNKEIYMKMPEGLVSVFTYDWLEITNNSFGDSGGSGTF